MPSRKTLAILAVPAVVLIGCGAFVVTFAAALRTLFVARSGVPPWSRPATLVRVAGDAAAVQRLEETIRSLPPVPPGLVACPADDGTVYHLTFFHHGAVALQAAVNATGCRWLRLGAGDVRRTDDAFWALFARTLGIAPADLSACRGLPLSLRPAFCKPGEARMMGAFLAFSNDARQLCVSVATVRAMDFLGGNR